MNCGKGHGGKEDQAPCKRRDAEEPSEAQGCQHFGGSRKHGVLRNGQLESRRDVHDRQCRQERHDTEGDHRQTVQRAQCHAGHDRGWDRNDLVKPEIQDGDENRSTKTGVRRDGEIDPTSLHVGARTDEHNGHAIGEDAENRRLLDDVEQIVWRSKSTRGHGKIQHDHGEGGKRPEAYKEPGKGASVHACSWCGSVHDAAAGRSRAPEAAAISRSLSTSPRRNSCVRRPR